MTMVKRDTVTVTQIDAAKVMPGGPVDEDDDRAPNRADVKAAEAKVKGTTAAPGRLPGLGPK